MTTITYIDRQSTQLKTEAVFGAQVLQFLYGKSFLSQVIGSPLRRLVSRNPLFSKLYGCWQKQVWTKRNIRPFIEKYEIDSSEFLDPVESYSSFNDFFTRKLKPETRPIAGNTESAIIPADGRYLFFQNIDKSDGFIVKGKKFDLGELLDDEKLAAEYQNGSMVISRLCPVDYHRFHFPVQCVPSSAQLINGWLYSVNPIALKKNISIFTQNKRAITTLSTHFGNVLYIEIGATNVGSIIQTYMPNEPTAKGAEKGYFSFGASCLIILFPPNSIQFDKDLLDATSRGFEIKCLLGQTMGETI